MSVAFIKRKPDITPEQFYHHWETVHARLVKPWAEKHRIVGYTQVSNPFASTPSIASPPFSFFLSY
jgi:hypothetical protein